MPPADGRSRREGDMEAERVWRAIERHSQQIEELGHQVTRVASTVDTHTAVCTEAEKARVADRGQMKADLAETKALVEGLAKSAADKDAVARIVKRVSGWAAGFGTAVAGCWAFAEHAWPMVSRALGLHAALLILLCGPAMAHEDDPVLRELQTPTGGSCCHERDCSLTDDWDQRAGAYVVRHAGVWRTVPGEIVIQGQRPHPSGRAVLCILPGGHWLCFLPGAPQT